MPFKPHDASHANSAPANGPSRSVGNVPAMDRGSAVTVDADGKPDAGAATGRPGTQATRPDMITALTTTKRSFDMPLAYTTVRPRGKHLHRLGAWIADM